MISLLEKQKLEQFNFEPLQNFMNNFTNYYACLLHFILIFFFSIFLFWRINSLYARNNTMLMTFSEYLELFETDDSYTDLMVTLFEQQDLIIKTNEIKHLVGMVKHLQNKISHLQEYMQESFDTMEAGC